MAYIAIPDVARLVLEGLWAGQHVVNIYHFLKTGSWDSGTLGDLIDAVTNWLQDNLEGAISQDFTWIGGQATDLSTESGASLPFIYSPTIVGDKAFDSVQTNVAGVVSLLTDQRGRSYRGRSYVPGISVDDVVDAATMGTSFAAALAAAYSVINLYTGPDASATHVVPSLYHNNAPRGTGIGTAITAWRCDTAFDSQRRRLKGRGT